MKEGSMTEAARLALVNNGDSMKFKDLWAAVKEALEISPEEEENCIGQFYTNLSLAGSTFVGLPENVWDLRSRQKFDKVDVKMEAYYEIAETQDEDPTDQAEENEYNASVRGGLSDGGVSDTGATDGEGLDDNGNAGFNDYVGSKSDDRIDY